MPHGIWIWPSDAKEQSKTLKKIADSPRLMAALSAIAKSKEGLSNAEIDDAIDANSEWTTLWVLRQLTSLGLVEYKVDFFGNPNRYELTDQGRAVLSTITGKPIPTPIPASPTLISTAAKPQVPATVASKPESDHH